MPELKMVRVQGKKRQTSHPQIWGPELTSPRGGDPESPRHKPSIDAVDLPSYSATDSYVEEPETHEQFAIGETTSDAGAAVETHLEKVKEEIKETDEKLNLDKGAEVET
jgi:hypothetical protein